MFKYWKEKFFEWFKSDNLSVFLILFFFSMFAILIIFRLYGLQVVRGDEFREKVVKKSQRYISNKSFERGKIYFKNGEELVPVAIQKNGYLMSVDNIGNKFIKNNLDVKNVYDELSTIIDINKKDFLKKVALKNRWIDLKEKISKEDYWKIKKLNIKGLSFNRQSWRYYPFDEMGGKIIGFLDKKNNGVTGLEKYYNDELSREFKRKNKNIFLNIFSKNSEDFLKKQSVVREGDLFSTVDINVQDFLEKKVQEVNKKYSSKDTLGIIIRPESGEIVAMTDNNPLNFNEVKKDFRNKMVESRFEPGSVIKPLVVAAGLDSNSIDKNFSYYDRGCREIQSYKVCNYDKIARGANVGLVQILKESLNLGMVSIQRNIKNSVFLDYFLKFGFSEESGIDLPNEINSTDISSLNYNIAINYATASFGQGIAASPVSTLRALSIIANDGFIVNPHVVNEINYGTTIPAKITDSKKEKVLPIESVDAIQKIMVESVNKSDLKQKYQRPLYSVAAKTGTAQIADGKGGYKEDGNIHAFFGFFPVNAKPEERYAIILYTFEPRAKYSSETLTKPFYDIVDFLTSYFDIKPDRIK